ncbi:hypothetical protein I545_0650 [Mycobacterium kansasii 662]|uniref:Uncharacterized protein n=2 Tax=Mycobacterium kansasii TaxID=1768 RepID=A0A1V3XS67_MYCKA|nr:hypothetical protein I547_0684 [Mycobacterium kansasii 824]EUA20888.1 hypothetical protein I545_0650 [Mycobacterium kansasii 662]OOK81928.1 hypothetical protein BZL30_1160 [Mycobacterium kansasii]
MATTAFVGATAGCRQLRQIPSSATDRGRALVGMDEPAGTLPRTRSTRYCQSGLTASRR